MDGDGHTHHAERGAEKLMDDYLQSIGFHRKKIAKDGSCLFRAVAEQVLHSQSLHTQVRAKCVQFLKKNRETYEAFIEGDFEDYLWKLQDPQQWVGEVEINALAVIYKRDFLIFQEPAKPPVQITNNNFKEQVRLCFLNGNHYDSVYPISHIKNAALCQSVLYELLYDSVFGVERSALSPVHRTPRSSDVLIDDHLPACSSSEGSDMETEQPLWVEAGRHNQGYRGRGRGRPLPGRVRRSLNPTLFRNVEYDIWHKTKRAQQKMDYSIAAGMQYAAGDSCRVRIDGRRFNATVKEVASDSNSKVLVHIDGQGTRLVPLWSLRPPGDENSWSTVVNKEKRLSNGYGGGGDSWERGRGRGRGRSIPSSSSSLSSSSSVSQATAPGSSGRMLKQHSWPPQATVEEPGGAKTTRKSVSSLGSDFAASEKERLAREEEDRNMALALVEIELRDEESFPALGAQTAAQGDGGRRKGGEKRRPQRSKTKSPVEDVRAPSPSAGEPRCSSSSSSSSSTPPTTTTTAAAAQTTAPPPTTTSSSSSSSSSSLLPAAPTPKTNTPSYASAAGASSPPAAPAAPAPAAPPPSTKPSVTGGAAPPPLPPSSVPSGSFLTPVLPPAASSSPPAPPTLSSSSPVPPLYFSSSSSSSSSSSLPPPKPSPSPPPPSSVPPPTFIAPIAPSPVAAQGFLPPSSLPRSSPSPPTSSSSSSSSLHHAPPGPALSSEVAMTTPQSLHNQNQVSVSQTQTQEPPVSLPPPQTQTPSLHQVQPQVQFSSQSQSEMVQVQSSLPPDLAQPPPVSHLPHPSHPFHPIHQTQTETPPPPPQSESPAHPPALLPQSAHPPTTTPTPPPVPHPPQSVPGAVPLQKLSQLYQDPLYPGFPLGEKGDAAPTPPFSSSKSGDDLPQDVNILRFFFNLGVKAYSNPLFPPYLYLLPLQQTFTVHQTRIPSRPSSPTPILPPPAPPSSSNPPAPHHEPPQYPPPYPPTSAPMVPPQYEHQHQHHLQQPPPHADASYNQGGGYAVSQPPSHRMPSPSLPWQQQQQLQMPPPPRSSGYPAPYPTPPPPYSALPPSSQGYHHPHPSHSHPHHQGQGQMYPPASSMPPYPHPSSTLGYQSSSGPEELQVSQGLMEQLQPHNGDSMLGQGAGRVPGPLEVPAAAANVANANNNRTMLVQNSYGMKKTQGETKAVLLVDPPLNNRPIVALVSNCDSPDVSMVTAKHSNSGPGSPLPYGGGGDSNHGYHRLHQKTFNANQPFVPLGAAEPKAGGGGHLATVPMATELLSVGCSTEDDWQEMEGFKPAIHSHHHQQQQHHRGPRRPYRGGRGGRGGSRGGRRPGGDGGMGYHHGNPHHHTQFVSSHRGRGW